MLSVTDLSESDREIEETHLGASPIQQGPCSDAPSASMAARTPAPLWLARFIHHHDVARAQLRDQDLLDIILEELAVDRPVEDHRRDHAAVAQPGDKGGGLPMFVWDGHTQPLSATGSAVGARHLRRGRGLVDEHEPVWIEVDLAFEPLVASAQDVRAILLRGMTRLFLRVMQRRWKKRRHVP